ncbi:family S53 protease [Armillaria gallica]|uniref:Family S53 protease n=1 Tax=Armillaria gallica TaxID=47427 RepID=A0A2H3E1W0_ARMGA|nr:family S53 protease [Armillaria gallica]
MFAVISLSVALFAVSSVATGSPAPRVMSVHERRDAAPNNFVGMGAADPQANLNFRIGLTPKDIAGLEKALYAVSEPDSDLYGKHLSFEEVKGFSAPTPEAAIAVTAWLAENGIADVKLGGAFDDWLTFTAPVDKANTLLSAHLTASIPSDLADFIEVVHPTTSFARLTFGPKPMVSIPLTSNLTRRANPAPASCNTIITPACLQALYDIPTTRATQSTNRLGVTGFFDQFAQMADLRTFLIALRPDIPPTTTFTFQSVNGGLDPQGASHAGVGANLDIEYTVGVATGVPTVFISVGDSRSTDIDLLDLINFLIAEASPPQVLTTSYSFDETDIPAGIATRLCNAFMALGARGVSILFASGDGGVGGSQQGETCTTFIPTFPSGCPFITSVGATQGVTETAANFSSGGFSNVFARPSYQFSAVSTYLTALGNINAGRFNATGRGFPDVAAQGNNIEIVSGGRTGLVGGTSCPIFASVISLINDRLIATGKPALGFLNPFLYANPNAFFDITNGDNPGCGTNGFPALAGWDPVAGLGTPNFAALLAAAGL